MPKLRDEKRELLFLETIMALNDADPAYPRSNLNSRVTLRRQLPQNSAAQCEGQGISLASMSGTHEKQNHKPIKRADSPGVE